MDRFAKMSFAEKLKDKAGILDAAKMVVFDVTIHLPVIYFPTYYTVKEFVGGSSWNPVDWVRFCCVTMVQFITFALFVFVSNFFISIF